MILYSVLVGRTSKHTTTHKDVNQNVKTHLEVRILSHVAHHYARISEWRPQ